jgi:hypothetical protein
MFNAVVVRDKAERSVATLVLNDGHVALLWRIRRDHVRLGLFRSLQRSEQ